jgi:hypothetical protein
MKGRGTPVTGKKPTTDATLMRVCSPSQVVIPIAKKAP